ncbi:DUF1972 domain-containing protein [Sphingomonas sp.]|uniref:DUF1972 domain-containing protein n=1 Tax=Sphingomonas sp. TaxID=28214 RepID=UPI0025D59C81|nr:DUF1972 domain-containing protein [Sphingomonas sp.]
MPHLIILGIRGIPAAHGGFETFAERLALWLRDRGWKVTVYSQGSETGERYEDRWEGIDRIHLPVKQDGALGTIEFDIKATRDSLKRPGMILTLGYNTGFLCAWLRLCGRMNYINMDGLEWKRAKYAFWPRLYLWINERLAAWSGNRLIADHPAIADHLATRTARSRISMIAYGADSVEDADPAPLARLGLEPGRFFTLIARPEPENSVLEIVTAFSEKPRDAKLALLGNYCPTNPYHEAVRAAAGSDVVFTGAIYDRATLAALRYHSIAYLHGHQVGGTNPSLVEALGAGNAIIAHDNKFNRWVAGDAGLYFADIEEAAACISALMDSPDLRTRLSAAARERWKREFTWPAILDQYERLLKTGAGIAYAKA